MVYQFLLEKDEGCKELRPLTAKRQTYEEEIKVKYILSLLRSIYVIQQDFKNSMPVSKSAGKMPYVFPDCV